MVKLTFESFNGEMPKLDEHYLPEGYAVTARNVRLSSGSLRALRAGNQLHEFPANGNDDFTYHDGVWLGFNHDIDAAPGPVDDNRLYVTHSGAPPQLYRDGAWYPLALPNPTVPPAPARTGTLNNETAVAVAYCFTWVTSLGEESGPSPVSASTLFSTGTTITLTMPAGGNANGRPVAHKRIYRSLTSTSGTTDFYLIAQVPAADTSFADIHGAYPEMEAMTVKDFDPPPAGMQGLVAMPNGMMAAFSGKELLFSEPWQPHAWPGAYALTTNTFIVGLCAIGTSLAVMTRGNPYIVQGLAPDAMAMQKVESPYPCLAKRSIVDMGYAAVYASPVGLVEISESGARVISSSIWTKDEWGILSPSTMRAARFGDAYVFSCVQQGQTVRKTYIVNLSGETPALSQCDLEVRAFFTDAEQNRTFFLDADGRNVLRFDAGDPLTYTWRSKQYRFGTPEALGALRIETPRGATGAVSVMVFADGELKHTVSAVDEIRRLPDGEHRDWQFVLTGTREVLRVSVAQTPMEVAN